MYNELSWKRFVSTAIEWKIVVTNQLINFAFAIDMYFIMYMTKYERLLVLLISDHNNVDCVILKDSKQKWQVKISKLFIWSCRSIDWLRNQTISHSAMQSLHIINEISQKKLHSGHIDISGGDLQTALSPRQRTPRQLEVDRWGHCDIWLDLKTHLWKVVNNLFCEFSL